MNYGRSMEMREVLPDTLDEDIYTNSNLNPLTKLTSSSRNTEFKDILPQEVSQIITKTVHISTRIVISNAMKHPNLNMMDSQWNLRQERYQNFQMQGKPL